MSKATGVWTLESWALVLVFAKCKPDLTYRVLSYGTVVRAVVLYSDPPSPGAPKETVSACSLRGHSPMSLSSLKPQGITASCGTHKLGFMPTKTRQQPKELHAHTSKDCGRQVFRRRNRRFLVLLCFG